MTKRSRVDNFHPDGTPKSGAEVIEMVREESDTILLAFSRGKDSIATWLAVRDHFPNIIPYHMYLVPDLNFVEDSLKYFEDVFQTHIIRVPHPSLYRWLANYTFSPPERCSIIDAAHIWQFTPEDLRDAVVKEKGLSPDVFTAVGVRAADSPQRRMAVNTWGAINWDRRAFWPVWDMYKDPLIDLLKHHNIKLPIDYEWFNRSFDGLDYRFTLPLKEYNPDDYQKILDWFPLLELDIMRYNLVGGTYETES